MVTFQEIYEWQDETRYVPATSSMNIDISMAVQVEDGAEAHVFSYNFDISSIHEQAPSYTESGFPVHIHAEIDGVEATAGLFYVDVVPEEGALLLLVLTFPRSFRWRMGKRFMSHSPSTCPPSTCPAMSQDSVLDQAEMDNVEGTPGSLRKSWRNVKLSLPWR